MAHKPKKHEEIRDEVKAVAERVMMDNIHLFTSGQMNEEQFLKFVEKNIDQKMIDPKDKFKPKKEKVITASAHEPEEEEEEAEGDEEYEADDEAEDENSESD